MEVRMSIGDFGSYDSLLTGLRALFSTCGGGGDGFTT